MVSAVDPSDLTPPRDEAIPETYAVHVSDGHIDVWQYRVDLSRSTGEWRHVERQDRDDDPKLSLEYATLTAPAEDGYWVYCKSYSCTLDCE